MVDTGLHGTVVGWLVKHRDNFTFLSLLKLYYEGNFPFMQIPENIRVKAKCTFCGNHYIIRIVVITTHHKVLLKMVSYQIRVYRQAVVWPQY
jgi:hypothetical protein